MSIALLIGNNLTTNGVFTSNAVNNTSCNNITSFAGISGGGTLVLLSTQTASSSSTLDFTTGIDSTYDEYIFEFLNIHPQTDAVDFTFQASTNGGSSYGVNVTTTTFRDYNYESGAGSGGSYVNTDDLASSTSFQILSIAGGVETLGNDNDQCLSGYLKIFDPSDTSHMKHFISNVSFLNNGDAAVNSFPAGYFNTTSALNAFQFKMSSGNIDDGKIKLYGVKKT